MTTNSLDNKYFLACLNSANQADLVDALIDTGKRLTRYLIKKLNCYNILVDDVEDYILYITYVVLKDYDESKGKFSDFATYVFTKRLTTKLVNICSRHDLKVGSLDENLQDGTPLMEIIEDKTTPTIPQQVSFNNFRLEISSPKSNTEQERNKTKVIKLLEAGYTGCEIMKILCLTKGKYRYIRDLIEQDLKLSKIKMELK